MGAEIQSPMSFVLVLRRDRTLVNRWLVRELKFGPEVPARLARAMRYAVLGPGKRIRPVLALEAFRAAGGKNEEWIAPFCCGIEMVHAFSLVHDDLPSMDNDDFRRGRPSLHRKYDEATAILAGDALLTTAFGLFAEGKAPAGRRTAAMAELVRAIGPEGMAGGQMLDVRGANTRVRKVIAIHEKKTAVFFAASLTCGAVVAGGRAGVIERLREAGHALGRLFQVTDDLLDAYQHGEPSRPSIVGLKGVEAAKEHALREAEEARDLFRSLGPRFGVLAGFPDFVVQRRQ